MKRIVCLIAPALIAATALSQEVTKGNFLEPDDLGITKFLFKAKPASAGVVVFRCETYRDGILENTYDNISNNPDDQTYAVVLIDWSFLQGRRGAGYTLKSTGSSRSVDFARLSSVSSGSGKATLVFHGLSDKRVEERKFVYTIFLERYEDAKTRIPALPANVPDRHWTFAHSQPPPK